MWALSACLGAGEAGGCVVGERRIPEHVVSGAGGDPAGAAREAGRRARGGLRCYGAASGPNRLGTLTYAPQPGPPSYGNGVVVRCADPEQLRLDVAEFFRDLWVWVLERHKDGVNPPVH